MSNTYEPLDLVVFDEELAGKTLNVLRNPTRGFRKHFLASTGDEFTACVAEILGVPAAEIEPLFDEYDNALFNWLLMPELDADKKLILPYVYELWDRASEKKVRTLRSPLSLRAVVPATALASPRT